MVSVRLEPANVGLLADACEGGIGLSAGQPLVLHQLLRLKLQFDDGSKADAAGEVVWVSDTRHSGGLRFTGMDTGSHERIRTWISTLPQGLQDAAKPRRNLKEPNDTLRTVRQRPEPPTPKFSAVTASRMQEEVYAGASSVRQPLATPPSRLQRSATQLAGQVMLQTDASADSLPLPRANVSWAKTEEEQGRQERLRRFLRRGTVGIVALIAIETAIVLVQSERANIGVVIQQLEKSARDFFAPKENGMALNPPADPRAAETPVDEVRARPGLALRSSQPRVSSSGQSSSSRAANRAVFPVYRVSYLGKEWGVIPSTRTIMAFQNAKGTAETGRHYDNSITPPASRTNPTSSLEAVPAANPAPPRSTQIPRAPDEDTDNQTIMPVYSPLNLGSREVGEGSVILSAIIRKDGNVRDVRLLSKPSELASAIAVAVRRWRYKPVLQNGEPTEVDVWITVDFIKSAKQPNR